MAFYNINEKIQPVVKYEYFDQDNSLTTLGYQEMMTFGLNYFINKKIRFQINYQAKEINGITKDNDVLLMQLQVRF